ncbi:hypothetical protein ABPG72_014689 [Tetrahymena utriculariae]
MGVSSLCFFFLFWFSIYIILMVINHLGPHLYQSQYINSATNRCIDEYQNKTSVNATKLPYYVCQISLKPADKTVEDNFLIRIVLLLNNEKELISSQEKYQIQMSQIVYTAQIADQKNNSSINSQYQKEIEFDETFPQIKENQYDQNWKIIHNNLSKNISFYCTNSSIINKKQNNEGCYSNPILEETREDLKQEYILLIKINKHPNIDLTQNKLPQNKTRFLNEFELESDNQHKILRILEQEEKEAAKDLKEGDQNEKSEDQTIEQNKPEKNTNTSKIRKILFQLKYKNSIHALEMIMKSLYSIVTAGFFIYTLVSLKNFYADQLISIQKWIKYLLAFLLVYNSPVHLFFPSNKILQMVTRTGELIFLSLIMFFWLSIKSMNRHSQSTAQNQAKSSLKGFKIFLKILLVFLHNAPRVILSFFFIGGAVSTLTISNNRDLGNFDSFDLVHKLAVSTFFIYTLCIVAAMLKVCIENTIDTNFKFLCYFTYAVFYSYGYMCYQEFYIPEENHPTYLMLNKESILNIYIYVITYLYLPVENKNDEQQYNLDHHENDEEDDDKHHKEIIGEVYKDIEMDETIKNQSHIHNSSSDQKKQKIWESIQKSLEDEDDQYEEKKEDNSDSHSSSDDENNVQKNSSDKKISKIKQQPSNSQKPSNVRKQKFVDDAQEELDQKEFVYE